MRPHPVIHPGRANTRVTPHPSICLSRRRSCSTDKSPGSSSVGSPASQRKDIGRSESLRVVSRAHRIFRPSDLIHGEVLGKGCFGQAIKVCHQRGDTGGTLPKQRAPAGCGQPLVS